MEPNTNRLLCMQHDPSPTLVSICPSTQKILNVVTANSGSPHTQSSYTVMPHTQWCHTHTHKHTSRHAEWCHTDSATHKHTKTQWCHKHAHKHTSRHAILHGLGLDIVNFHNLRHSGNYVKLRKWGRRTRTRRSRRRTTRTRTRRSRRR